MKSIRLNLTRKVALLFAALTFVLIVFMSGSLFVYFKTIVKQSLTNALTLVTTNNADNVDQLFLRIELASDMMENADSNFVKYLMEYHGDILQDVKTYRKLETEMKNIFEISLTSVVPCYGSTFLVDENIPLVSVFPNSYRGLPSNLNYYYSAPVLYNSKDVKQEDWYKKTDEANGDAYWFKISGNKNIICMSKTLYTFVKLENNVDYKKIGVFFTGIDVSWLTKIFDMSKLTYGTVSILSDTKNRIIYSSDASVEGKNLSEIISGNDLSDMGEGMIEVEIGTKKNLLHKKQLRGGLNLITIVPGDDINKITNGHGFIVIILALIMMLAGLLLVIYISHIIVRPITKLAKHMKVNENMETILCSGVADDEIGVIYNNYNTLMEQIKELIHKIYDTAELEKETRLKMLQAQINPHFIYNTLDSICCISLIRKQEDIAEILSRLANLMRYNINEPDAMITVKKEVEQIFNYVQIQKFRDGSEIEISTNVNSEIENFLIPKMIIQPLVENSLFYGGKYSKVKVLKVELLFYAKEDMLRIEIRDNGDCDEIEKINQHLKGDINISKKNGGFGIRNVEQRIQMKFGFNYHLHYEKGESGETVAVMNIPKIQK